MKTVTVEVIINGNAHYPRLYLDDLGHYRGRGLPEGMALDNPAREALNWYCKGFGDAVNEWIAVDGNEWYQDGVKAGERWKEDG